MEGFINTCHNPYKHRDKDREGDLDVFNFGDGHNIYCHWFCVQERKEVGRLGPEEEHGCCPLFMCRVDSWVTEF